MSTAAERKFINIRKRLDQLGYRQPLSIDCLPLVEKLFSDLVHTTESLRKAKLFAGKAEKETTNFDYVLEPYKNENAKLIRENNELHLDLLRTKEQSEISIKDLKVKLRKVESEMADLKFLNNQYVHKFKMLEKESKAKNEKIQQLQEKNLQAVVQTPGGRKRGIPFRRQRMQIDQPVPPSGISAYPVPQPNDPYIADLLQVADNRIFELQEEVCHLQGKLAVVENALDNSCKQIELRDREIERLSVALDGGRSHDVLSLESRNQSNEKLITHLNIQIDFLQQTNRDLENRIQELLDSKKTVTTEVLTLSNKNETLSRRLNEIDHIAHQMEKRREEILESTDKQLVEAELEIKRLQCEMRAHEETIAKLKMELSLCHKEKARLTDEVVLKTDLETIINQIEHEKNRLARKVESFASIEKELVLELERMKKEHGITHRKKSSSRLDIFVKSVEEERDHYKKELERLQKIIKHRSISTRSSRCERSLSIRSPEKGTYISELNMITKERDELQSLLDRFENHMGEIQCNVKLLTAERDKLSDLYNKAQHDLSTLRKETTHSLPSQDILCLMEKEKESALSDLRLMIVEKEALREKLKNIQELAIVGKTEMEKNMEDLENINYELETERCDLKSKVSMMKETIESLENKLKLQYHKLIHVADDSSQQKTALNSLKIINEQLQRAVDDCQHRFAIKSEELQAAQMQIASLEEKINRLTCKITSQDDELVALKNTICVIDKEKDYLQEVVDEKTEKIASSEDNIATKEKTISHLQVTLSDVESTIGRLQDLINNRERELTSVQRQLDENQIEIAELERARDIALKENRRLQDDLATMTRENQAISLELEQAICEKEEMKNRVHNYITEVSRCESLMAAKEQENQDLLGKFQMLHSRAEDLEIKAHHAEGESSSIRLELLSVDTDRRHLRERVDLLEKEIQEHINAHHAYESQISSMTKTLSKLEEKLRCEHDEKASILSDLSSLRELCIKLDSSKEFIARQLASKNIEYERVLEEVETAKTEAELLKKQLSSERITVDNLETLLATNRDKEFQSHITSHEKDSEILRLKDLLALSESKLSSHIRETNALRAKIAQFQSDHEVLKRQLTTEQFERERAIQEMRRHGIASTLWTSSPCRSPSRTSPSRTSPSLTSPSRTSPSRSSPSRSSPSHRSPSRKSSNSPDHSHLR
ncbi:centrosomal protein of 135 kDa [Antechinus flavipes]|uniref:centrosomal protein of 135 kDa n=1 Tax=Antechinus flavipes TaxID=38775 RepID=UPI00223572BD|nr:centrosomal protein of 135 kDa [Antechinus flavipes]